MAIFRIWVALFAICFSAAPYFSELAAQEAPPEIVETDLDALITTLDNEVSRNQLIAKLEQLRQVTEEENENDPFNSINEYLNQKRAALDAILLNVASSWNRIPEFATWLQHELANPIRRGVWLDVAFRLSVVFFIGWLVVWIARKVWPEPDGDTDIRTIVRRSLRSWSLILVYSATTLSLLYTFDQPLLTRLVGRDLLFAVISLSLWRTIVHDLFFPFLPSRIGEATTRDVIKRLQIAGGLGFGGFFILNASLRLGLPWSFHAFALHLLFFIVAGVLISLMIRLREPVALRILRLRKNDPTLLTNLLPVGFLSQTWHIVAIAIILAHYLTWALSLEGGLYFLAKATTASLLIIIAARVLSYYNDQLFEQTISAAPDNEDTELDLQERASRYANPLRLIARWIIIVVMFLALTWVWRLGLVEWLRSEKGETVITIMVRLALLGGIALVLTEGISYAVSRYTQSTNQNGDPKHSNRSRTLAAILKNIAIVLVIATAVMMGLSEIGVDAAALFAGAGVIGLAIGFGSQRLVQDLINGLFILLGDTVRVGDVVEVGGKAGVVENMSMRTISLRAYDGSVHTVPYSSIDTITNLTKDYAFAVIEIGVSYDSDIDLVFKELLALDQTLRREWPYRRLILAPLEIAGVDSLGDSAVVVKARSKVRPGEQWGVRRELTRRIKERFDEVGIEIPYPHRTILVTQSKKDSENPLPDGADGPTIAANH